MSLKATLLKLITRKTLRRPWSLLPIDGDKTVVGTPEVKVVVTAEVVDARIQADKVTSIRYKSKKRVHKVHGHRQHQTRLKIKKIA